MTSENEEEYLNGLQSQLVQLSRTRRLCCLLVDCDSTGSGVKLGGGGGEWEESGAIPAGVGLGTAAMSACWREMAVAEVQRVLSRFECSSSPHAVAAKLINVYDRLKQAMVELFGGHFTFALGLKEGFTKAFQSLTGVTVCELWWFGEETGGVGGDRWSGEETGGVEGDRWSGEETDGLGRRLVVWGGGFVIMVILCLPFSSATSSSEGCHVLLYHILLVQ